MQPSRRNVQRAACDGRPSMDDLQQCCIGPSGRPLNGGNEAAVDVPGRSDGRPREPVPEPREFERTAVGTGPAPSTTDKAAEARPLWPTGPRLRSTAAGSTNRPLSCRGPRSCDLVRVSSQGAGRARARMDARRQVHGARESGSLSPSCRASASGRVLSTAFARVSSPRRSACDRRARCDDLARDHDGARGLVAGVPVANEEEPATARRIGAGSGHFPSRSTMATFRHKVLSHNRMRSMRAGCQRLTLTPARVCSIVPAARSEPGAIHTVED
jgi:hypothetical protein